MSVSSTRETSLHPTKDCSYNIDRGISLSLWCSSRRGGGVTSRMTSGMALQCGGLRWGGCRLRLVFPARCRLLGLSCRLTTGWGGLSLAAIGRSPQSQVVTEELHDQSAITIRLLRERVEFCNSIVKSLLGQVASSVRRVQNLVVENREIEGETKTDGVGRGKLSLRNVRSILKNS